MKKLPTLKKLASEMGISEEQLLERVGFLFTENRPSAQLIHLLDKETLKEYHVTCTGIGNIKHPSGDFIQYSFEINDEWKNYSVLVKASSFDEKRLPRFEKTDYFLTRFDSHCETQMLFGDLTCDCMGQLQMAIQKIAERGEGAIIHIKNHEGRGKGIASKLDQLAICNELGVDTVTASKLRAELVEGIEVEHFPLLSIIDTRDFLGCVAILKFLNVPTKIKLMLQTNNPNKTKALSENGYEFEYYNVHTEAHDLNRHHLQAKKNELGHNFNQEDGKQ